MVAQDRAFSGAPENFQGGVSHRNNLNNGGTPMALGSDPSQTPSD